MKNIKRAVCALLAVMLGAVSVAAYAANRTYIRGDADKNGVVDVQDTTTIQLLLAELVEDTDGEITLRGDITGDGLDISDATQIQMFAADYENIFHIGEEVEYPQPVTDPQSTTKPQPTRDPYELPFIPVH